MKKLTKKSLDELAQTLPVIEETKQKTYVGGGNGTSASPFTVKEFNNMLDHDIWQGGYVEGMGYVANDSYTYGKYKSSLTVTQSFYTFSNYMRSLSSDIFEEVVKDLLSELKIFEGPLKLAEYLENRLKNMAIDIQVELLEKGYNGTSSFSIVRVPEPIINGSTKCFVFSVYNSETGEFITAREFNIFGKWSDPTKK